MGDTQRLLRHQLATLAYRTRKALRAAPADFGGFIAGSGVRTPHQMVNHMTNLLWHTVQGFLGEDPASLDEVADFAAEVARFHQVLGELSIVLGEAPLDRPGLSERLLQGPLSDAMTHAGQLALLRRLAGSPIPAEDFSAAPIGATI